MLKLPAPLPSIGVHGFRAVLMLAICTALPRPAAAQSGGSSSGDQAGSGRLIPLNENGGPPPATHPTPPPTAVAVPPPVQLPPPPQSAGPKATPLPVIDLSAHPASGAPIVSLIDLETSTLGATDTEAMSQALWQAMLEQRDMRLLPRKETRFWLIEHDLYPFMPYREPVPLERVGQALHVDYLVTGRAERSGDQINVTLSVYDVAKGSETPVYPHPAQFMPDHVLIDIAAAARPIDVRVHAGLAPAASEHPGRGSDSGRANKMPEPATKQRVASDSRGKTPVVVAKAAPTSRGQGSARSAKSGTNAAANSGANGANSDSATSRSMAMGGEAREGAAPSATPAATPRGRARATPTPKVVAVATPNNAPAPPTPAATATPESHANDAARADALFQEGLAMGLTQPERIAKMEQGAKLAPDNAEYQKLLAGEYYRLKRYDDCVAACDLAQKGHGPDTTMLTLKGSALYDQQKLEPARLANEAAIAADPTNLWARHNLAVTLMSQNSPKAIAAWHDYIDKAKDDPEQKELVDDARKKLADLEKGAK